MYEQEEDEEMVMGGEMAYFDDEHQYETEYLWESLIQGIKPVRYLHCINIPVYTTIMTNLHFLKLLNLLCQSYM